MTITYNLQGKKYIMNIETIFKDIMENLDQYSLETQLFIKQKYLPLLNRCNQVEHFLQQIANIYQTEPELLRLGKILAAELKRIQERYS